MDYTVIEFCDMVFGMGETGLSTMFKGEPQQPHHHHHSDKSNNLDPNRSHSPGGGGHNNGGPPADRASNTKSSHSLFRLATENRARRVRFYRNGDRFFKGLVYAVCNERLRTFENLLTALTASPLCDKKIMPNGVRVIFTLDGSKRVDALEELRGGESYVCSSTDVFRPLDYCKNEDRAWNTNFFPHHVRDSGAATSTPSQQRRQTKPAEETRSKSECHSTNSTTRGHCRPHSGKPNKDSSSRSQSLKNVMDDEEKRAFEEYQRSFVTPRLITIIRNGRRPRRAVRMLLNKKTAQSFEQVMVDITEIIKLDCGSVKKLYTLSGRQVLTLADFFQEENVFLACGLEKVTMQDFVLDKREIGHINAYRPYSGKQKERITLRKTTGSCVSSISKNSNTTDTNILSPLSGISSNKSIPLKSEEKCEDKEKFDASKVDMPTTLTNKYEIGPLIGTGNFAIVLECKDKKTQRKFALKIINRETCKGKEKMIDNEVRILRCVKHPNIIRLIEDFSNQLQIFYVMELVKGGDLFDAIASSSAKYTEEDASGMLFNLASALEYLHSLHIVHRDVKPENILLREHEDGTKSLKLGDFGLATEVKGPLFTVCGTPTYVAPEVIAESGYGVKIDVWSTGVITYILLCGFPPFSSPTDNQDELFDLIMGGNYDFISPYWDDVTASAKSLISGMLNVNPDNRLSASQVLQHPWVSVNSAQSPGGFDCMQARTKPWLVFPGQLREPD
ncbi:Serine/threonine-protein kinase dclk1 [Bulinus truncatus]|nr:Serine/threonine-protein kinase dclk1 [Bulinus truncatus]